MHMKNPRMTKPSDKPWRVTITISITSLEIITSGQVLFPERRLCWQPLVLESERERERQHTDTQTQRGWGRGVGGGRQTDYVFLHIIYMYACAWLCTNTTVAMKVLQHFLKRTETNKWLAVCVYFLLLSRFSLWFMMIILYMFIYRNDQLYVLFVLYILLYIMNLMKTKFRTPLPAPKHHIFTKFTLRHVGRITCSVILIDTCLKLAFSLDGGN